MKKLFVLYFLILCMAIILPFMKVNAQTAGSKASLIPNFVKSPYFDEQVLAYTYNPNIKIEINAPSAEKFDASKPTAIVLFGLPNGNTTDWTIGKLANTGDDWHYQIQHIGAQTRYIRSLNPGFNLVTVYLEASSKSWGTWRSSTTGGDAILKKMTEDVMSLFANYNPYIIIDGHSGGGNIAFGIMDAASEIPTYVKKIAFIDSDYNWDNTKYGPKLLKWLNSSKENKLTVICYDDLNVLLNGEPIVSATGGTWYRTQVMQKYLQDNLTGVEWTKTDNDEMTPYTADNKRIEIIMKKNPTRAILHTVLVEKNGFIQSVLGGGPLEGSGYSFYGDVAYTSFIQSATVYPHILKIPPRKADAIGGTAFMASIKDLSLANRESAIYKEISEGNIPNSFRQPVKITQVIKDALGIDRNVEIQVLPDVIAVGSDDDFVRVPMLPNTAQMIANLFGATLPTRKISDLIHKNSVVMLTPQLMTPDASMTTVPVFISHNSLIEESRKAMGQPLTALISGHKKDIVITNRLSEVPQRLYIYGWHYPDGTAIQPLSGAHDKQYVDYSHGVRMVNNEVMIDNINSQIKTELGKAASYTLFSNENGIMSTVEYTLENTAAPAVPMSFAVLPVDASSVKVLVKATSGVNYDVMYGESIGALTNTKELDLNNPVITGLNEGGIYFFALRAKNTLGTSASSEVLGVNLMQGDEKCLIVNGFDRAIAGNNHTFISQHGEAFRANNIPFASATNDAVTDKLVILTDYTFVDYILGEESTADKTFDVNEQENIKTYLKTGGRLFVSGSEIGWDLGRSVSGSASNSFMKDYLNCSYVADNPGSSSALYYEAQIIPSQGFGDDNFSFQYADGNTTTVKYPDVLKPENGALGIMKYKKDGALYDVADSYAGTAYEGKVPDSQEESRIVVMGIPFETIYPEEKRSELMKRIYGFMALTSDVREIDKDEGIAIKFSICPNPASISFNISFDMLRPSFASVVITNLNGTIAEKQDLGNLEEGRIDEKISVDNLTPGMYFCSLMTDYGSLTNKLFIK